MSLGVIVDIVGWLGALVLIVAYILVSYGYAGGRSSIYQILNVIGSVLLIVNTAWHKAWPSSVVNVLWVAIGIGALTRGAALRGASTESSTQQEEASSFQQPATSQPCKKACSDG